jgi:very-short-patch-repair endonuclease
MSIGEETFALHLRAARIEGFEREYRFAPPRRWRMDFADPARLLAVEVEGGTWTRGRHTRGAGFAADCEKYSTAAAMGWRVLRFTTDQVRSGMALRMLQQALEVAA